MQEIKPNTRKPHHQTKQRKEKRGGKKQLGEVSNQLAEDKLQAKMKIVLVIFKA